MKKINKIFALLFALLMFINPIINVFAEANGNNQRQIGNTGGESVGDGVKISKTISPSELENYFDITLKVQTTEIAKEQDLAVVIVMDISNTMIQNKVDGNTKTRLRAAMDAGEDFINNFASNSLNSTAKRKIGYVAFNSNANQIFELQGCKDSKTAENLTNVMETQTKNLVRNIDSMDPIYKEDHIRFTNIEAGLKMAYNMLYQNDETKNIQNKYVILLSDGFPTTYDKTDYVGYDTYDSKGTIFRDRVKKKNCNYGTDYSEEAARRAQIQATKLKTSGTIVYAVGSGIDANAKTIDDYYNGHKDDSFSVIDRYDTNYAIGNTLTDFKHWLGGTGNSAKPGIGSGYKKHYFDATDTASLKVAYDKIFEDIKYLSEASWVAEDPMNSDQTSVKNVINFVGIYDNENDKSKLYDSVTYNSTLSNNTSNNTAYYNSQTDKINWDLKNSKYTKTTSGNTTYYNYELKYRIRLKTEANNFMSDTLFNTNGVTTLSYVIRESGKEPRIKKLEFKIPSVKGYFGKLEFDKLTNYGNKPLEGSTFEIYHSDDCPCLKERRHIDSKFKMTSVSNSNGKVIFDKIPSGHKYKIHEVSTDDYHDVKNDIYDVNVSYGETASPLKDTKFINNYKTRNLTIIKVVEGVSTTKKFKFQIEATYKGNNLEGTYDVVRKNGNTETTEKITFSNGKATIELKDKEQITIKDLPYSISYKISETNNEGFIVKYQINDGAINIYNSKNIKSYTLDKDSKIKFTNISGYELPATGSSGMLILLIIGSLLLVVPIIYISVNVLNKRLTMKH